MQTVGAGGGTARPGQTDNPGQKQTCFIFSQICFSFCILPIKTTIHLVNQDRSLHHSQTSSDLSLALGKSYQLLPYQYNRSLNSFSPPLHSTYSILLQLRFQTLSTTPYMDFPGSSDSKQPACNVGDLGWIPGLERSPG